MERVHIAMRGAARLKAEGTEQELNVASRFRFHSVSPGGLALAVVAVGVPSRFTFVRFGVGWL